MPTNAQRNATEQTDGRKCIKELAVEGSLTYNSNQAKEDVLKVPSWESEEPPFFLTY